MSELFSKEEMAEGFVEGAPGKSEYKNLDKRRIDLIKGYFNFLFLQNCTNNNFHSY